VRTTSMSHLPSYLVREKLKRALYGKSSDLLYVLVGARPAFSKRDR